MEGRGGCCLARYGADVTSRVDRIMLRFRPIAPKPAVAEATVASRANAGGAREKRRGLGERVSRRGRKKRVLSVDVAPTKKVVAAAEDPVTLQLMPETPERKEPPAAAAVSPPPDLVPCVPQAWCGVAHVGSGVGAAVVAPRPVRLAGSWVTLECLTDTCGEEVAAAAAAVGCTAEEARRALEGDTCPAFLSDAWDRVTWTNEAYRRMVGCAAAEDGGGGSAGGGGVSVALVTGGMVPARGWFACRVRVKYACRREKGSLTAPCDVWRLEAEDGGRGGLAWRVDVAAALSLGR